MESSYNLGVGRKGRVSAVLTTGDQDIGTGKERRGWGAINCLCIADNNLSSTIITKVSQFPPPLLKLSIVMNSRKSSY